MSRCIDQGLWREGILDRVVVAISTSSYSYRTIFIKAVPVRQFYRDLCQIQTQCERFHRRLEYYSNERLLALLPMPSAIHGSIQAWVQCEIRRMAREGFIKSRHWTRYLSCNYSMGTSVLSLTPIYLSPSYQSAYDNIN